MPLSPPPGIFLSRLSVKSAEAVFYLLAQDIWLHGVRQRLLCKMLHWVPVLSQVNFRLSFDMLCQLVHQLLFMARGAEKSREHCLIGLLQGWALEREQKNVFFLQRCWRPTCNRGLTFGGVTVQTVRSILSMHVWSYSSCDQGQIKTRWPTWLIFVKVRPKQLMVLQSTWGKILLIGTEAKNWSLFQ